MLPQAAPEQPEPDTDQVTAVLLVFSTVAENDWVALTCKVAVEGATATEIAGSTVTLAEADLLMSACEVAVTVTVAGEGTVAGAV